MRQEQFDQESNSDYLKRVADYDPNTDKLMRASDILAMLKKANVGVSRGTFDRWVSTGEFPKPNLHIGKIRKWTERRVKEWLQSCVDKAKSA